MFQAKRWKRLFPTLVFFTAYSLLFLLWKETFLYSLPLALGFLLAWAVQPAVSFLSRRLGLSRGAAALAATGTALAAGLGLAGLLGFWALREAAQFIGHASENGFQEFSRPVADFLNRASQYLKGLDMEFLERHREEILAALQNSLDLAVQALSAFLGLLGSVPTGIALGAVTACSAFFFARDMTSIRAWVCRLCSEGTLRRVRTALESSRGTGRRCLGAYLFLYFLTFCETCVILGVLGFPYPLLLSLLTAVADVLPVLGPGLVLAPVAAYQLLLGEYGRAAGVLIGWGVITCIRQGVEPRLISSTMKLHPLVPLAAVYFSLVGKSLWILFYVLGLFALYGALSPLLLESPEGAAGKQ